MGGFALICRPTALNRNFKVNTHEQTLTRFYTAFCALDADTMVSCYAQDVAFDDPVFTLRGVREAGGIVT